MGRHSLATKAAIRRAQMGKQNSMYGKHHTKETRVRLSKNNSGIKNPMYGKRHSAETRKKISLAMRRSHRRRGDLG